jgi:hypothetical protein
VLVLALPLLLSSARPAHAGARVAWEDVLARARAASRGSVHEGEMLIATFGAEQHAQLVEVSAGGGATTTTMPDDRRVRLSARGGELRDPAEGFTLPLPPITARAAAPRQLTAKYDIDVAAEEELLGRPCTRLDVRTRGGELRERLWVDDRAGLVLRRETYQGDELLRLAVYLRLGLDTPPARSPRRAGLVAAGAPGSSTAADATPAPMPSGTAPPMEERQQGVATLTEEGLDALLAAGWEIPDALPSGYAADGAYVVAGEAASPLQLVYSDGLYTVSLFQQAGAPDPGSLPAGGQEVDDAGGVAWSWSDAVPLRRVWEAEGTTWTLVTDAPPGDVQQIVAALPRHRDRGPSARLRAGLGRLWSWVSPWS